MRFYSKKTAPLIFHNFNVDLHCAAISTGHLPCNNTLSGVCTINNFSRLAFKVHSVYHFKFRGGGAGGAPESHAPPPPPPPPHITRQGLRPLKAQL